ncbi:hypothetical protein AGLY_012701 [Aphis glycines]|uniref:Uncharacterized protein n=1 Tax=Aphis glycines TaxID=307491 RepID=A0A6G0T8C4_APHGL|nr:hypothetical protein AGLY_012701 [Aphis glycines]
MPKQVMAAHSFKSDVIIFKFKTFKIKIEFFITFKSDVTIFKHFNQQHFNQQHFNQQHFNQQKIRNDCFTFITYSSKRHIILTHFNQQHFNQQVILYSHILHQQVNIIFTATLDGFMISTELHFNQQHSNQKVTKYLQYIKSKLDITAYSSKRHIIFTVHLELFVLVLHFNQQHFNQQHSNQKVTKYLQYITSKLEITAYSSKRHIILTHFNQQKIRNDCFTFIILSMRHIIFTVHLEVFHFNQQNEIETIFSFSLCSCFLLCIRCPGLDSGLVDGLCSMGYFLDLCFTSVGAVLDLPSCFFLLFKTEYD